MTYLDPLELGASLPVTLIAALLCSPAARGNPYDLAIPIQSESELYDLRERGDISAASLEALLELLRSGVDLNRATAEELYELPGITWRDVALILAWRTGKGGAVPGSKELRGLAAFLRRSPERVSGTIGILSRYTAGDPIAPPGLLRARLSLPMDLSLGLSVVTTRLRLGHVSWDAARNGLIAVPATYGAALPKFFVLWRSSRVSAIFGTFRIGFAERLTLDNTRRQAPYGFHSDELIQRGSESVGFCRVSSGAIPDDGCGGPEPDTLYATPDFRWQDGFRGIAASLQDFELGTRARLAIHAFGSYQPRSIYQYEIFNRDRCVAPRSNNEGCRSPPVFEAGSGDRRLDHVTLPDVFDEMAGGGNASIAFGTWMRVGVTGYVAAPLWRVGGSRVDFQESSDYPSGGPFGAAGVSGLWSAEGWRFSAEVARSFDRQRGGGGGIGVVQRSVRAGPDSELELALRYFDARFVNPHARPVSAPDEFEGQRARNEAGARLRYMRQLNERWRWAASGDVWLPPEDGGAGAPAGQPKVAASARTDVVLGSRAQLAIWARHARGPVAVGCARCVSGRTAYRAGARARLTPFGRFFELSFQYAHALSSEARDPA
ncbi:MAG TPA: hypothetical protein VE782_06545, partial [Myxococcaceae bacterium]|nr:hypothetical protein [Myxococcaceae bacterium]